MSRTVISASDLYQWRQWAMAQAIAADISVSEVDWLLQALTSVTALDLKLGMRNSVESRRSPAELTDLWHQRVTERVPVQYLVGKAPWRNFELLVTPNVLIPRPETEYLIDLAQEKIQGHPELATGHWVDLGTGSGAIALGLAEQFPAATIHAVDKSAAALAVARQNAENYHLSDRIYLYQGDWWKPLAHLHKSVSGMISNPPYIPSSMLPELQPEVFCHEPHSALNGGSDGLEDIRKIIDEASLYLVSGGIWLIEMMLGQGQDVAQLLSENNHYTDVQVINDFAGGDRYVYAKKT